MSHQATESPIVGRYFGAVLRDHAIVRAEFHPDRGWVRVVGFRKRISGAWARKLRAQGVTSIQLSSGGRSVDFTIAELLRRR
jgi:hypothetical protein